MPGPSRSAGPPEPLRRPIAQRSAGWAVWIARNLCHAGVRPNQVSVASMVFAMLGCACLILSATADDAVRVPLLLAAAVSIPLRLLCNMFDGMLAVEGGLHTPTGELFNELPDRLSDLALLAGAGYAASASASGVTLGWLAGSLAVLTAYARALGTSAGTGQFFGGVLPKQRRMWLLLAGIVVSIAEPSVGLPRGAVLVVVLALIAAGSALTVLTRLRLVAAALNAREGG